MFGIAALREWGWETFQLIDEMVRASPRSLGIPREPRFVGSNIPCSRFVLDGWEDWETCIFAG